MLESEAIKKWCPEVRCSSHVEDSAWNCFSSTSSRGRFPDSTWCLGSLCAMWREEGKDSRTGESIGQCGKIVPLPPKRSKR